MQRFFTVALVPLTIVLVSCSLSVLGHLCDFDHSCSYWNLLKRSVNSSSKAIKNGFKYKEFTVEIGKSFSKSEASGPRRDAAGNRAGKFAYLNAAGVARDGTDVLVSGEIQSTWYKAPKPGQTLVLATALYGRNNSSRVNVFMKTKTNMAGLELKALYGKKRKRFVNQTIALARVAEPFQILLKAELLHKNAFIALDNLDVVEKLQDGSQKSVPGLLWFDCGDGKSVPRNVVCDLKNDCHSNQDEAPDLCGQLPNELRCTFENSGMCGWQIDSKSNFDWKLHSGQTPTPKTGPEYDHTFNNKTGHYVYTEANGGNSQTHKAMIKSRVYPPLPREVSDPTSPYYEACKVRFFYHKKGNVENYNGKRHCNPIPLKLSVRRCDINYPLHVWNDSSCFSSKWKYAAVTLKDFTGSYWLQFKGNWVIDNQGDMALDDISLSPECFSLHGLSDQKKFQTEELWSADCPVPSKDSTTVVMTTDVATVPTPSSSSGNNETDLCTFDCDQRNCTNSIMKSCLCQQCDKFEFTTCGKMGKDGPTQTLCDSTYSSTPVKVTVISQGHFRGVQVWTVPENGTYEISTFGASGGKGVKQQSSSKGGYAKGRFNLTAGEVLHILVGQEGSHACSSVPTHNMEKENSLLHNICKGSLSEENEKEILAEKGGGGGGGGGATFVFKVDENNGEVIPLLVAGGGGGLAYRQGNSENSPLGGKLDIGPPRNGFSNPNGSGGGGSLKGTHRYPQSGRSLMEGATGGQSCQKAINSLNWNTYGGFGGGGGACSSGGGGGGYSGGNVSLQDSLEHNGEGGTSYHHPDAMHVQILHGHSNEGDGFVEILQLMNCLCQYLCNISDFEKKKYTCKCQQDQQLGPDGHSCIEIGAESPVQQAEEDLDLGYIIVIPIAASVLFIVVSYVVVCLYKQHQRRHMEAVRLELITANQGYRIRTATANGTLPSHTVRPTGMMAEYNPNYDFIGAKYPEQHLTELNRHKLRLARALGQGAFGEVYKGYLASVPHVEGDLPVAVKTLPAFRTEQSEMDFLMEAVIMSKFSHPNIVRFLGVCFESHPRYIILELLEGGDLKSFLREMRPKPDSGQSPLNVADLLKLSLDIARGCQHLEECHFIHRDIAARNCLLTCKGEGRIAKIADFGMARDIYRSDYYKKGGKAMLPIKWMPPEAFLDGLFTTKTDVWSFGILLWEIFSMGYMPYPGRTNHDVMHYVTAGGRLEPPDKCPPPLYQLMSICWAAIPETRPNFSELIEQLERCTENPDVLNAELPVFFRIPTLEKDLTVIRPQSSVEVLSVHVPCHDNSDDELCNNVHESESKEPLLPPSTCAQNDCDKGSCGGLKAVDNGGLQMPALVVRLTPPDCVSTKSASDSSNSLHRKSCSSLSRESSTPSLLPLLLDATTQCGQGSKATPRSKSDGQKKVPSEERLTVKADSRDMKCKKHGESFEKCSVDSGTMVENKKSNQTNGGDDTHRYCDTEADRPQFHVGTKEKCSLISEEDEEACESHPFLPNHENQPLMQPSDHIDLTHSRSQFQEGKSQDCS